MTKNQRYMCQQGFRSSLADDPPEWWTRVGTQQGAVIFNAVVFLTEDPKFKPKNHAQISRELKKEEEARQNGTAHVKKDWKYQFEIKVAIPGTVDQQATLNWECPRAKFEKAL